MILKNFTISLKFTISTEYDDNQFIDHIYSKVQQIFDEIRDK
jgi:hypothetical protein